jgi:DNA primase
MDVISLEKVGIKNAMALMGTAFSNFHLQIFKELKKPIKLFLDGDNAGINAMYKISEILIKNNLKFSIIDNNTKHDPDELVNQGQKDQILKMIAEPINPYQYFLNKLFNEQKQLSFDQLTQISEKILSLLKYESNYLLVDKVENILSTKLGVSKLAIDKVIQQDKKNQSEVPKKIEKPNLNYSLDKYEIGRNRIFVSLLKSDEFLVKTEPIISQISGTIFYEKIFKSLINFYQTNQYQGNNLIKFFELLQKENFTNEEINLVKQMIRKPPNIFNKDLESRDKKDLELSDQEFNDIIKEFKIKEFDQEISSILKTIQDLDQQITMVNDQKQKEILKQKRANSISRSQKLSEHKRELNKEKE